MAWLQNLSPFEYQRKVHCGFVAGKRSSLLTLVRCLVFLTQVLISPMKILQTLSLSKPWSQCSGHRPVTTPRGLMRSVPKKQVQSRMFFFWNGDHSDNWVLLNRCAAGFTSQGLISKRLDSHGPRIFRTCGTPPDLVCFAGLVC